MEQNLEQLCVQIQQGKRDAQEVLEVCWPLLEQRAQAFWKDCKTQYKALGVAQQDLVQEGSLGLLKAIMRFDPEKGESFLAYGKTAVHHAMVDYVRTFDHTLEERNLWDLIPLDETTMGIQEEALKGVLSKETRPEPILIQKDCQERFCRAYEALSPRDQMYLGYRFGMSGQHHDRIETARKFSLTDSRAKKVEQQALKNMKNELRLHHYPEV